MAHGVKHNIFENAVGVEVTYDDEIPMRYCEVTVFSPLDPETEYQEGFTDKNGRFAFCPDSTGTWQIIVDDGMGHAISEEITIEDGMQVLRRDVPTSSKFLRTIIGIILIIGIFRLVSMFMPWKRLSEKRSA